MSRKWFRPAVGWIEVGSLAAVLASCAPDAGEASNDITPAPEARLQQTARIDGGRANLVPIGSVAVDSDGHVYVTQPLDQSVRVFDQLGRPVGRIGRRGEGPGEFLRVARLSWLGDSLVVHDPGQGRITVVGDGLTVARTSNYPTSATIRQASGAESTFSVVLPLAVRSGGEFIATLMGSTATDSEDMPWGTVTALVAEDGSVRRVLAKTSVEGTLHTSAGATVLPFAHRTHTALSANGDWLAVVRASTAEPGELTALLIDTANGDTVVQARRGLALEPIPSSVSDSVIRKAVETLASRNPALAEAFEREVEIPRFYPPIERIFASDDGAIFVRVRQAEEASHYLVIDQSATTRRLALPPGAKLAVPRLDAIWTIEANELDIQSVIQSEVSW